MRTLPADCVLDPRVLGGFQLLFNKLDRRIADVIEDGIDRCALFQRVALPRVVESSGGLIAPVRERFIPLDRAANPVLVETVHGRLRPRQDRIAPTPGPTRAKLHSALIHRPESGGALGI